MYGYWQRIWRDMTDFDPDELSQAVREVIARRRISRQALADMSKISVSTLEKALAGTRPFTLSTIIRIEEALGTRLRPSDTHLGSGSGLGAASAAHSAELAPAHLGSYSHAGIKWIEGRYLTLRPSFKSPGDLFCYAIDIQWNGDAGYLGFAESQRVDAKFEQIGVVSMPNLSGHIYLVTNDEGQHRMMVLSRPTIDGTLYGILTTLQVGHGSQLVPVSCPVALVKWEDAADPIIGTVAAGAPQYENYRQILDAAVSGDYVRFYE
jgi:transcriptional regulator with XRE-family HTH domain